MTTLRFTGTRRQAFTVHGPVTGDLYYVDPGAFSGVVEFDTKDAKALLENDPELWEQVGVATPITAEEAALLPEAEVEVVTPRGGKGKKE